MCALALVGLPRHSAASGLAPAEWWRQVRNAAGFGLLNALLVLDSIKVLMLFLTGPYVILKLPEGPIRAIVRIWDTCLAEEAGFEVFHVYVCASFLLTWSAELRTKQFQDLVMVLNIVLDLKMNFCTP